MLELIPGYYFLNFGICWLEAIGSIREIPDSIADLGINVFKYMKIRNMLSLLYYKRDHCQLPIAAQDLWPPIDILQ